MMNKGLRGLRVKENGMGDPLTFVTFGLTDKCQDIGYPDVPLHRLPLMSVFVPIHRLP